MDLELMRAGFPTVIVAVEDRTTSDDYPDKAWKNAAYAPFVQQFVRLPERSIAPYRYLLGRD